MSVAFGNEVPDEIPDAALQFDIAPEEIDIDTRRLLGAVAVNEQPTNLFEVIVRDTDSYERDDTQLFASRIHAVLNTRLQSINTRNGLPTHQHMVNHRRVVGALSDYYNVFKNWPSRIAPQHREAQRQAHLREQIGYAYDNKDMYPEIRLLIQLESDLRTQASELAGDTALELLAAYGWATRPDYVAVRMTLMRHTENINRL
jgi:hypothetical protein